MVPSSPVSAHALPPSSPASPSAHSTPPQRCAARAQLNCGLPRAALTRLCAAHAHARSAGPLVTSGGSSAAPSTQRSFVRGAPGERSASSSAQMNHTSDRAPATAHERAQHSAPFRRSWYAPLSSSPKCLAQCAHGYTCCSARMNSLAARRWARVGASGHCAAIVCSSSHVACPSSSRLTRPPPPSPSPPPSPPSPPPVAYIVLL